MNDNYPLLTRTKDFVIFLHNNIYTNEWIISKLKEQVERKFDLFQINYNDYEKRFEIKVKKSNIKKIENFSHTAIFYYNIIDSVMFDFFRDMETANYINTSIDKISDDDYVCCSNLRDTFNNIMTGGNEVSLLYTVTPIPENSIYINL